MEHLRSVVTPAALWGYGLVNNATMNGFIHHLLVVIAILIAIIVVPGGLITGRRI